MRPSRGGPGRRTAGERRETHRRSSVAVVLETVELTPVGKLVDGGAEDAFLDFFDVVNAIFNLLVALTEEPLSAAVALDRDSGGGHDRGEVERGKGVLASLTGHQDELGGGEAGGGDGAGGEDAGPRPHEV